MHDVIIRTASLADANQVAEVYLASRKAFLSFAPFVHTDAAVRQWVAGQLIPTGGVTVAVHGRGEGPVVGMMALAQHEGIGWTCSMHSGFYESATASRASVGVA